MLPARHRAPNDKSSAEPASKSPRHDAKEPTANDENEPLKRKRSKSSSPTIAKRAVVSSYGGPKLSRTISIDRLPEEGKRILHATRLSRTIVPAATSHTCRTATFKHTPRPRLPPTSHLCTPAFSHPAPRHRRARRASSAA